MFIEKIMNRFEDKFIKRANGCWLWISSHNKSGYGLLWINRKGIKAHRIAYTLYKGIIPFGMHVLHRCDNPPCVNPDHLFLGTQTDNNLDRDKKGRNNVARGEDTALAKLTTKDVLAIEKGGYNTVISFGGRQYDTARFPEINGINALISQDRFFWQALGKALGKEKIHEGGCYSMDEGGRCDCLPEDWWSYKAHQYFDLLLTGGDVEKFWKELLKEAN